MLALVATVFVGCDKDKDNDGNLAESIVGSWMNVEEDGRPMLTNHYSVINFVSAEKAYFSSAAIEPVENEEYVELWNNRLELDVRIDGKTIVLSIQDEVSTSELEFNVISLNADEIESRTVIRTIQNGEIIDSAETNDRLKRVNVNYKEAIIGIWEGRCTSSGGSVFDDGESHRWEYKSDGTYCYYYKENDEWKLSVSKYSDYFVEGPLLCTRWQNEGEPGNIENWEIESISDNVMKWKALRMNEEGDTYTVNFEMRKVQ